MVFSTDSDFISNLILGLKRHWKPLWIQINITFIPNHDLFLYVILFPNTDIEIADSGIFSLPLHRFLFVCYFVRKCFPIHDLILKN